MSDVEHLQNGPMRRSWIVAAVVALTLTVAGVGIHNAIAAQDASKATSVAALAQKVIKVQAAQAQKVTAEQALRKKARAGPAEAVQSSAKARRAKKAEDAKAAENKAERALRQVTVVEIQQSIMKTARTDVRIQLIDGPIIGVSCEPVAGGSVDDLSEKTTVFKCFVANKLNEEGTRFGYSYHATMNWGRGSYTYGFDQP